MYVRRIAFVKRRDFAPEELTPLEFTRLSPPEVSNPSDNFRNLFEVPVIVYTLALYLFVTDQVDTTYMTAAWLFIVFRVLHSAVHCTVNIVMMGFYCYFLSTLAVWFMVLRAASQHFSQ